MEVRSLNLCREIWKVAKNNNGVQTAEALIITAIIAAIAILSISKIREGAGPAAEPISTKSISIVKSAGGATSWN